MLPIAVIVVLGCLLLAGCMVQSSPGIPVGNSVRVPGYVATLIRTNEPHAPRVQGNEVLRNNDKLGLLLVPLDGSEADGVIKIAGGMNLGGNEWLTVRGETLLVGAGDGYTFDLRSERVRKGDFTLRDKEAPRPISHELVVGREVRPDEWMGLHVAGDTALTPGARFLPQMWPLRSYPSEGKRERRKIYRMKVDRSDVLPRVGAAVAVSDEEYPAGAMLKDSSLVIYEDGPSVLQSSLRVMRVDEAGKALWKVDTGIWRLQQILPGEDVVAFRGEPVRVEGKFPQPLMVVVDVKSGKVSTTVLRW